MPATAGVTICGGAPKLFPPEGASQIETEPVTAVAGAEKLEIVRNPAVGSLSMVYIWNWNTSPEFRGIVVAPFWLLDPPIMNPGQAMGAPPFIVYRG